ncbi:MAG: 3-isopropylmalate dehydratase large subunit [Candidatus Tectimicrobiota bacterium]|nr:MAG: 3-isopropylmalate dehydratase large subunit [Candidatus Tectomicrobia bacterium]
MGMTMTEHILARASGQARVQPGDLVVCRVDRAVLLDLNFGALFGEKRIRRLADPRRVAIVLDHSVPAPTVADAENHRRARAFAAEFGIRHFYDVGAHGICHQVIAEQGLALPGQLLACGDSHTCGAGAFNCAARGMGAEMLAIVCTGQTWFRVGPTVQYVLHGQLRERVAAKDVFLHIAGTYGEHANTNVEFTGPGLATLSVMQRHTIATMCAEISADFALFPADEMLEAYLAGRASEPYEPVHSDPDARFAEVRHIDLSALEPLVALPHTVVHNVRRLAELRDVTIHQAFIGSCANGKLEDLAAAARLIAGRRVAPGVRFIVTPGSQEIYKQALRAGYIETLVEAGAVVTNSTCGACPGLHMGVLGPGERCITSSTRNFQGRMGSPEAEIFLASSESVTAAAITGRLTDPRDL